MTLELTNVPKPSRATLGVIIHLLLRLVTFTARKLAHCLDHLVVVGIIKKRLRVFMVPVRPRPALPHLSRQHRKVLDHLGIVP